MATSAETESAGARTPLVRAREISRYYRLGAAVVPAVRDVSLEIRRGDFVALQGPSGSGKTTLLNLLGLLDRPDQGEISVGGEDAGALSEDARSDLRRDRFGFVFQTFNLLAVLSAEENVAYPMALAGVAAPERTRRARELLDAVGLEGKYGVRPDLLSGGQRQRVAIARALVGEPKLVLADEPTGNLDPENARQVLALLREQVKARGAAGILVTHSEAAAATCDRRYRLTNTGLALIPAG